MRYTHPSECRDGNAGVSVEATALATPVRPEPRRRTYVPSTEENAGGFPRVSSTHVPSTEENAGGFPLEEWSRVRAAAAAEAERTAARADAAQFDGQADEHEAGQEAAAMATELEGAEEDEAEEVAAAAAAAVAAATAAAAKATQPTWKAGERHAIAEIKYHAIPGSRITFVQTDDDGNQTGSVEVTIKERYFHVRWAGAKYRGRRWWSWEAQSELVAQVPEMVGAYCKANKLVVPRSERERVEAAMAEEAEAEAEEAAAAGALAVHGGRRRRGSPRSTSWHCSGGSRP
jgi:hypothetical protein